MSIFSDDAFDPWGYVIAVILAIGIVIYLVVR